MRAWGLLCHPSEPRLRTIGPTGTASWVFRLSPVLAPLANRDSFSHCIVLPRGHMLSRLVCLLGILLGVSCGASGSSDRETLEFTVHEGSHLGFDLSPDGRTLVFDLLGQLWLLPSNGGLARPLTNAARDAAEDLDPSFLPDGRGVLFQGERGGRFGLWTLNLDGSRPVQVIEQDRDLA